MSSGESEVRQRGAASVKSQLVHVQVALDSTPHSTLVIENLHRFVQPGHCVADFLYVLPAPCTEAQAVSPLEMEACDEILRVVNQSFDRYAETLATHNLAVESRIFIRDVESVEAGILEQVEESPPDLLVLGMQQTRPPHRGWRITSTSYAIATQAPCSVLVMKYPRLNGSTARVLFATDGSPHAERAAVTLTRFLPRENTEITVFSAVSVNYYTLPIAEPYVNYGPLERSLKGEAFETLEKHKKQFEHAGYRVTDMYFNIGDPVDQIIREVEEKGIDLVVVGSRGMGGDFTRWLLGSVSSRVLEYCPTSVAILK